MKAIVPLVGVIALAITSSSRGTTRGSEADSPASKNRLTLTAAMAATSRAALGAVGRDDHGGARGRGRRGRRWPGPGSAAGSSGRGRPRRTARPRVIGSSTTASAAAIEAASGCRSGENSTYDASADLEEAVGELAGDPDREQSPELHPAHQVPQIADEAHGRPVCLAADLSEPEHPFQAHERLTTR